MASSVAGAIVGSAAIGGVTSLIGARKSAKAAKSAAKTQAAAADRATDAQLEMYYQGREDLQPWRDSGVNAMSAYWGKVQAGPSEFDPTKDPGYEFGFKNFIQDPYTNAQTAKGKRLSGETLTDLTKFASDYASTKYDNHLNRYYASLQPYADISRAGQSAAAGSAQLAAETGRGVAATGMAAGEARAQGTIGAANAFNQGMAGVAGAAQNALGSYMDWKIAKKIGAGRNSFIANPAGTAGLNSLGGVGNQAYGPRWTGEG